jgi:very-short-patch-repair endonuclease
MRAMELADGVAETGYKVLRFTAGDVLRTPAAVVGQVRRSLGYSSSSVG